MSVAEVAQMETALAQCRKLRQEFLKARSPSSSKANGRIKAIPSSLKESKEEWERCRSLQFSLLNAELKVIRLAVSLHMLL